MENLNLTAEINPSQSAKEVADTITLKDSRGNEYVLINMDNPKYAPFEGIVELIPVRQAKGVVGQNGSVPFRHKAEVSWSVVRDKASQVLIGIHTGFDHKTGDIRWQKQVLRDVEFLDLSVPAQRRKYICIKYGPFLQGSPNFVHSSKTIYKQVDKEQEANQFMLNRRRKADAARIADSLYGESLKETALLLGLDPSFMSEISLQMEVIKFVDDDRKINGKTGAERFLEVYNSDYRNETIVFKRGLATGVLAETPNGILFNGINIGYSEDEAVKYLKQNTPTLTSIDTQAKTKQKHSKSAIIGTDKPKPVTQVSDKEFYERQIAELRNQLAEKEKAAIVETEATDEDAEDATLKALIQEAKSIGIKSPHLIGKNKHFAERVEILNKAILEHRTSN